MRRLQSPIWISISALIGAVIGILAIVRGKLQTPLLIAAISVWGIWFVCTQLFPRRQYRRRLKRQIPKGTTDAGADLREAGNGELAKLLLRHVNIRVTAALRSVYPNASWEWAIDDPEAFAVSCGIGRIRVFGVPDYEYADVTLKRDATMSCSLVQPLQAGHTDAVPPPNQEPVNPRVWYEIQGREILTELVTDLNTRGITKLFIHEDGEICLRPVDGGEEVRQDILLPNFPGKVYWTKLAEVLAQEGLNATALDDSVQVAW